MKFERLLEIFNSRGVIDVTLNNESVWIEGVNGIEKTVNVKDLKTNKMKEVSVLELKER